MNQIPKPKAYGLTLKIQMILFRSLIKTLTIQTLLKKSPDDICPKPKKLYKIYKLYDAKQKNLKTHRKKKINQILKLLNYKYLLNEKKP
jgi:hypothetical protein